MFSECWARIAKVLPGFLFGLSPAAVSEVNSETAAAISSNQVELYKDQNGHLLLIDGRPTMLLGMNWGYVPIGKNYSYNFWDEPEPIIRAVLDKEMRLLQEMGVNSIRQYNGIPPKWVTYIYDRFGISTMINHTAGRYGLSVDGTWVPVTNYGDLRTRELIKEQILAVVEKYKDTRGVVLWLLGNENNYGLHWDSFEIDKLPTDQQDTARARHLYSLFGELVDEIHAIDSNHPVAIANGDLQYIELIAELVPNLDILGSNVYRGKSARDFFQVVEEKLGIPALFTEFGSDAYNAKELREDHLAQAEYLREQWKEIYQQSYGKDLVGNAIGGYTFQWADGWWKYLQEENLDVQDTNASWPNAGYPFDYVDGQNNMNEEWFGICAKGPPDDQNLYDLYPRAAYYLLRDAYKLDPYKVGINRQIIEQHFNALRPSDYELDYAAKQAMAAAKSSSVARISDLRMSLLSVSADAGEGRSIGHTETFGVDIQSQPIAQLRGEASINILGNVASNPIDELFYEARAQRQLFVDSDGIEQPITSNHVHLYGASFEWTQPDFVIEGYYRRGHYHWADDGDFFNFYREAYYGPNPDIYNADVPIGLEFTGKRRLEGLSIAAGPQIYWGANPTAIVKYTRQIGRWTTSFMYQEDISNQGVITTLNAIPEQPLRRGSVHSVASFGPVKIEGGVLSSGANKSGREYQMVLPASGERDVGSSYADSGMHVLNDQIHWTDSLGAKARITGTHGALLWYLQGGAQGLVADGGGEQNVRFTGWTVRASGRGNAWHSIGGLAYNLGVIQIAPHVMVQRPFVGPLPFIDGALDATAGTLQRSITPRNILDDAFVVLDNRETVAAELLFVYDPTPGTWMWYWDNDVKEDAPFAATLDFVYRHQPTSTDAGIGFLDGGAIFAFAGAPPAQDVWELSSKLFWLTNGGSRIIANIYGGTGQSTGDDPRLITRFGTQFRTWHKRWHLDSSVKVNDWGPFDYHRVYNLTFPLQTIGTLSYGIRLPRFDRPYPRIGISGKYRLTDANSAQHTPIPSLPNGWGHQYEVMTIVQFGG